jgi:hypothetical protein
MTVDVDQMSREEWRELGFFYDYDKEHRRWLLVGSRNGLLKFRDLLNEYVADPRNEKLSEHEHYGPYMYLKVITWNESFISEGGIFGTLPDLKRLANIISEKLRTCSTGESFIVSTEYAEGSEATMEFVVKDEGFDPAGEDPLL